MIWEHFIEVFFHQLKHFAVSLSDHWRFAVDVKQDAERTEVISGAHLTDNVLTVRSQTLLIATATHSNRSHLQITARRYSLQP